MARDGEAVKSTSGEGAGELGRSVKFMRMLVDRGIKWHGSAPRSSPRQWYASERHSAVDGHREESTFKL